MIVKVLAKKGKGAASKILKYIFADKGSHVRTAGKEPVRTTPIYTMLSKQDQIYQLQADFEYRLHSTFMSNYGAQNMGKEGLNYRALNLNEDYFVQNIRTRGLDFDSIAKEFEYLTENRTHQSKNMSNVIHIIQSYNTLDSKTLSDGVAIDLASTLARILAPDCLAIGKVHRDTDEVHVHLMLSATNLSFKSIRATMDKHKLAAAKKLITEVQKERYPHLTSLPNHGIKLEREKEPTKNFIAHERQLNDVKEILGRILPSVTTTKELNSKLAEHSMEVYYRGGKAYGVKLSDSGLKVRFTRMPEVNVSSLILNDRLLEEQDKFVEEMKSMRTRTNERHRTIFEDEKETKIELPEDEQKFIEEMRTLRENSHNRESQDFEMQSQQTESDTESTSNENQSEIEDVEDDDVEDVEDIDEPTIDEDDASDDED